MMRSIILAAGLVVISNQAIAAPHPLRSAAEPAATIGAKPEKKSQVWGDAFPEGEKAIYLRLIESYRKADLGALYRFRDLLLKHYPKSVYADNALYLSGMLNMDKGRLADAVMNFGQVSEKYPKGNKRAAALYGKSIAYSKLNLPKISRQVLEQLVKEYPGSAESQRAWIDLRLKDKKG